MHGLVDRHGLPLPHEQAELVIFQSQFLSLTLTRTIPLTLTLTLARVLPAAPTRRGSLTVTLTLTL